MGKRVEVVPPLSKLKSWREHEMRQLSRMTYEELMLMPEELEIDGPYVHPDLKYFIRRKFNEKGESGVPAGTVEVFICIDIYENGQFVMGSRPSVEMTPSGKILNPPRGADPRD